MKQFIQYKPNKGSKSLSFFRLGWSVELDHPDLLSFRLTILY